MKNLKQKINWQKKTSIHLLGILLLSLSIFSCSNDDDSPTPLATNIEIVSGDNQQGFIGNMLTNPIEIIVNDQNGNPFAGATVSFLVDEGAISAQTLITNTEGRAFVNWTLGETIGNQVLTITSFVDGGTPLGGSPLIVTAIGINPCITDSNPTDLPIGPDAGTETISQINIADSFTIADVNVTINLTHTFNADLDISLISPTGIVIDLSNDNGGISNNYTNTVFDDDADTSITDGTSPFTGSFQPEEPLSSFNGIDSQGVWTLYIIDDLNGDGGILLDWSIELCQ